EPRPDQNLATPAEPALERGRPRVLIPRQRGLQLLRDLWYTPGDDRIRDLPPGRRRRCDQRRHQDHRPSHGRSPRVTPDRIIARGYAAGDGSAKDPTPRPHARTPSRAAEGRRPAFPVL